MRAQKPCEMDPEDKFSFASHAPEVDNSANAPEHDRAAEGLRVRTSVFLIYNIVCFQKSSVLDAPKAYCYLWFPSWL